MTIDKFEDAPYRNHEPEFTDIEGSVKYIDGSSLARPFELPRKSYALAGVFIIVAALIGAFMLAKYFDGVYGAPARAEQTVADNLARDVSYDIPNLTTFMESSDDAIKQTLVDAGYTTYETTKEGEYPDGGFDIVKLPSDVSLAEAGVMYASGISSLSATDASRLLKGSWTLSVNRSGTTDMRLKFADFSSGGVDSAIQNAMAASGLAEAPIADSGTDNAGNTYRSGTIEANGMTYNWRVSAIPLSSVYKIKGLPDTAIYVGVRMTK